MTDIRELLREATADLGMDGDPVARVSRAATRHRQRTGFGAIVAVAVAVAAIVGPLSLVGGGGSKVSPAKPTPNVETGVQHWTKDDGVAAARFGSVWGLDQQTATVDQLDPSSGKRLAQIPLPAPASQIAAGSGYVWVIGSSSASGGTVQISAIDPKTHNVTSRTISPTNAKPFAVAFADHSAWVTVPNRNQVWRFRVTPSTAADSAAPLLTMTGVGVVGRPTTIATTGNGVIWVQQAAMKRLSRIDPIVNSVVKTVSWPGMVFAPAGHSTLWATFRSHTILQLTPQFLSSCSACAEVDNILIKGRFTGAVATARGLFATVVGPPGTPETDFWSNKALGKSSEKPTAHVPYAGSVAADGRGVVIGAGKDGLVHWIPAK